MCGIAALVMEEVPPEPLRSMVAAMRHRGPDSDGFFREAGVGLGIRRLSFIDLEGGHQPLSNEDGQVVAICNGEIYNYLELRQQLQARGHHFKTRSDAEVLVHLWEDLGEAMVGQLRGMFALALWDRRQQQLFLARDRLGIKPLHYAFCQGGLIVGSELKTVLASGLIRPQLDSLALTRMFRSGLLPAPDTLLQGVYRLPAGHTLCYQGGRARVSRYWRPPFPHRGGYLRRSFQDWAEELRYRLQDAVAVHLRSDVPLGAWLSPGIDSSSIAGLMARQCSHSVSSFSMGFEDPTCDELGAGRLLDEFPEYRLQGHRLLCRTRDLEGLVQGVWHREIPTSAGMELIHLQLAQQASLQVKGVLTGEGSDEILSGYPWYRAQKVLGPLGALPGWLRQGLGAALVAHGRWPGAGRILQAPAEMGWERFLALIGRPHWQPLQRLFSPAYRQTLDEPLAPLDLPEDWPELHPQARLSYLDLTLRLPEVILRTLDLCTMAHSLEARVPFLDHPLVEFCCQIPPRVKMPGLREKALLRQAMRGILPEELRRRPKRALTPPTESWMASRWSPELEGHLAAERIRHFGVFEPAAVEQLRHQGHPRLLMLVLTSQIWMQHFLG